MHLAIYKACILLDRNHEHHNVNFYQTEDYLVQNFQLDLKLKSDEGGDTSTYILNGEWDLIGRVGTVNCFLYPINVTYNIQLVAVLNYGSLVY